MFRLIFATVLLAANSAFCLPAQVILFRHAEKPLDDSVPYLNVRGRERAAALPFFLLNRPVFTNYGIPAAIFAAAPTADSPSQRPIDTVTPYSQRIGVPIQSPYPAAEFASLAACIRTNADYTGKTVVVCWPHDQIPDFAKNLGVSSPPGWSSTVYDRVWVIRYNAGRALLYNLAERLLYGDSGY